MAIFCLFHNSLKTQGVEYYFQYLSKYFCASSCDKENFACNFAEVTSFVHTSSAQVSIIPCIPCSLPFSTPSSKIICPNFVKATASFTSFKSLSFKNLFYLPLPIFARHDSIFRLKRFGKCLTVGESIIHRDITDGVLRIDHLTKCIL